jgi:hypothetical protein
VAMVNGRSVTQSEVDRSVIAKPSPLQQQIYDLRKTALENLVLRIVLEDEARKRGITVEALKRELTAAPVEVPQSEIEQSYAENRLPFGTMSPDEVKERLRLDLESKARMRNYRETLSKLRESALVKLSLAEPTVRTESIVEHVCRTGWTSALCLPLLLAGASINANFSLNCHLLRGARVVRDFNWQAPDERLDATHTGVVFATIEEREL